MVLLLLPAVAVAACGLVRAALVVLGDERASLPVGAQLLAIIAEDVGLAPEVLPVVRIDALCLVVFFVERAPLGLEVEHPEVRILRHAVDEPRLELLR